MSKLYNQYKVLKSENENSIILFKSGIFYISLADDANFLSKKIGLKLTNFNGEILKCGFPVSRFSYYSHLLTELSIDFIVYDPSNTKVSNSTNCISDIELKSIVTYILELNFDFISFKEAFDILHRIQELLSKIYKEENI